MSNLEDQAYLRDLRAIEEMTTNWHWVAAPLTAGLGLLGTRVLGKWVADLEIFRNFILWLYEVVPGSDFESKSKASLLVAFGLMLLVTLFVAREIVGAIITQRLVTRINRTPHPMTTVKDMQSFVTSHANSSLHERFYFVPRGESIARVDATNAGHRGSLVAAFGWSVVGLFLLGWLTKD